MTVADLFREASLPAPPTAAGAATASGVTHDSRRVTPGTVFVAIKGQHADGHKFLDQAKEAGAAVAVVERRMLRAPLPTVRVPNSRAALADLSCAFFENPSQVLTLVGITGTNGKTTSAYLVEAVLAAAGHHTALLGTVQTRLDGVAVETPETVAARTTPEAPDLQALLARMVRDGASAGVMEVSSHALALDRVRGCAYDVGVFTNLSQDHLDFHRTMQAYFEAKCRLFEDLCPRAAVINVDDPWGRKLAGRLERALTFGLKGEHSPRLLAHDLELGQDGIRFTVSTERGELGIQSPLVGAYNASNLLAAAGVGLALNLPLETIADGIAHARPVPGRLERVDAGQPFVVLVDYAHTPDALERVLTTVRPLAAQGAPRPRLSRRGAVADAGGNPPGRVIVVAGCGGDRDASKRAPMGEIACRLADFAIFTADNPRSEDPAAICAAMVRGAGKAPGATYEVIVDREAAIRKALYLARPGDVVVLAGKGHEQYQVVGETRLPFDDRQVARRLLEGMG
ncbi:MAG: UDP-N-acetylmuramoyl-L-alanyl-D-glutamate--2,6-diaminopimelate ligase [Nitrospirae bacterium]|nr:UDP-N-acetylmuramoyl-L-alanyl-D-glutamate--2,6-diaminopimelate ligase [Nitrospirota bacterium]